MQDNRTKPRRDTIAQGAVTAARKVVTWPGRVGGWLVTVLAWWGGWEIGTVALREPRDFKLLIAAAVVFAFGTAFTFPDRFIRTIRIIADAWDDAKSRKANDG